MLNYKLLQIDLNQLTDEELELYLILKRATKRKAIAKTQETEPEPTQEFEQSDEM